MAYEAMNNAAETTKPADRHPQRQRHVDRPAGRRHERLSGPAGLRRRLPARCASSARRSPAHLPRPLQEAARKAEEYARGMVTGGTFFEELGFYYVGPIDGHNLDAPGPGAEERPRHQRQARCWSTWSPRRARATRPAENAADKLPRAWSSSTWSPASRPRRQADAPQLHQGLRQRADQAGRDATTRSSPSPPPCRPAPASTCSASASPTAPSTSASPSSTR